MMHRGSYRRGEPVLSSVCSIAALANGVGFLAIAMRRCSLRPKRLGNAHFRSLACLRHAIHNVGAEDMDFPDRDRSHRVLSKGNE